MGFGEMVGNINGRCEHNWRIFKDPQLIGSTHLSFFCKHCLELRKIKKVYKDV